MISIIIPAYNCSATLGRTLSSLAAQTVKNKFICTIVDDASTEDLKPIINIFEKLIMIRYIRLEENKGAGNARQVGLDSIERCQYAMFVDSDDILMPNAIQKLEKELRQKNPDILTSVFLHQSLQQEFAMDANATTWTHGKVYNIEFLRKNNITFPKVRLNEDAGFNTMCFELTENILFLDEPTYIWTDTKTSLTRSTKDFFYNCLPDYVRSMRYAYEIIFGIKDLDDKLKNRIASVVSVIYYFYESCSYRQKGERELLKEIKMFFEYMNMNILLQNEEFFNKVVDRLTYGIPDCQTAFLCEHTFKDFIYIVNNYKEGNNE